jgi:hypothetical protein
MNSHDDEAIARTDDAVAQHFGAQAATTDECRLELGLAGHVARQFTRRAIFDAAKPDVADGEPLPDQIVKLNVALDDDVPPRFGQGEWGLEFGVGGVEVVEGDEGDVTKRLLPVRLVWQSGIGSLARGVPIPLQAKAFHGLYLVLALHRLPFAGAGEEHVDANHLSAPFADLTWTLTCCDLE